MSLATATTSDYVQEIESEVENMLDFFYYDYADAVNPANDAAISALDGFLASLAKHHIAKNIGLPWVYSDEGDVAFRYPSAQGKVCYVYMELPKMKGLGNVYNKEIKELEISLDGTKNERYFWSGLEELLECVYGK